MRLALGRRQSRVQSRVRTLEIFKREAAQIGAEGGELPAVGADPEAMGSTSTWRTAWYGRRPYVF